MFCHIDLQKKVLDRIEVRDKFEKTLQRMILLYYSRKCCNILKS